MTRPEVLIERWLPTRELGIESVRERAAASALPPIYFLHVWWARRPLVASSAAILSSLLPAWSEGLAQRFANYPELATEKDYHNWFLRLCGILGDPVAADNRKREAHASGERLKHNPFNYRQAYKNSPTISDLSLAHQLLESTWERLPEVADPTAGGGSIPYQAIRYGLPSHANDLNAIAAAVLRAGVVFPARFGVELAADVDKWGSLLCDRVRDRLGRFFPRHDEGPVSNYIFARTVACPRTRKTVPLAPNWWLSKDKGGIAARLIAERDGVELDEPQFEIVTGEAIDKKAADSGTITRGKAISPWDHLVIEGDYIKAEAQAGRIGSILYAVVVRTAKGRGFRVPTDADLAALAAAEQELARLLPEWEVNDVIPDEEIGISNYDRGHRLYGITKWRQFFSSRQLLVHGTFVDEYRRLIPEIREAIEDRDRADAVLALLGVMQGKEITHNSLQCRWDSTRHKVVNIFDFHNYRFTWSYGEFEGGQELHPWALSQIVDAYSGLASFLPPSATNGPDSVTLAHPVPASVSVTQGNAGDVDWIPDGSVELVCIDPPYYDNVMYAELADFFYVWEKRTLGRLWPELFTEELSNQDEEAVKNDARFTHAGRQKQRLATLDYEKKMTAIFAECRRILREDGVMTVMFTHKKAEAWDTLGQALLEAGFTIEASWPIPTESEQSLHQAKKNAAASTIFLVCRKRPARTDGERVYFTSVEAEVRAAARDTYIQLTDAGMHGVDRLLATYGPSLSVISDHWPVYSSEPDATGQARLLRPEEALITAQQEVVKLQLGRLVASHVEFDPVTDFWLLAWDTFKAHQFPFDEARKLCLAVGGVDLDDLSRAKVVFSKSGWVELVVPEDRLRRDADSELSGVNRDRVSFPVLLDALHTAMYIVDLDGADAVRTWLERRGLITDARFRGLVEGALRAVPRVREHGELTLEEAGLLDRLVSAALPDISIPDEQSRVTAVELPFET